MDEETSLLEVLDPSQLSCLNEDSNHTLKSILSSKQLNTSDQYLLSDADEQLLLNIPFNQSVRIRSIVIKSSDSARRPTTVKLFVNRLSLDFNDVQDAQEPEVAQIIELSEEQVSAGKRIPLRFVRFQNVNNLHIFVASNAGEDETRIDAIDVLGFSGGGTKDLSSLQKTEG